MKATTKFVSKSWGYEEWLVNNDKYCGKILFVKRGHHCSFHYHINKTETFYILSGSVKLLYNDSSVPEFFKDSVSLATVELLTKGDVFDIPVGTRHQFIALEDTHIIEISTHHEDSDSIRIGI